MTAKTKEAEPKILFADEQSLAQLRMDMRGVLSLAKRLADLWNGMALVPPMSKAIMKELAAVGAVGFEDILWRYIKEETTRVHGPRYAAGLNRAAHNLQEYYDPVRATGILNAIVTQRERYHLGFHTDHIDFDDNGEPMITPETIQAFEGRFTAYDTPANRRKYEIFQKADEALKELEALMREVNAQGDPIQWQRGKGLVVYTPLFGFGRP